MWTKVEDSLPEPGRMVLICVKSQRGYPVAQTVRDVLRAFHVPARTWPVDGSKPAHMEFDPNGYGDGGDYEEATGTEWWPENWYEANEYEETHWAVSNKVTHWCELPALPKAVVEPAFKELDVVVLLAPSLRVPRWTKGTIVHVHGDHMSYEVEFELHADGKCRNEVLTLLPEEIYIWRTDDA